MPSEVKENLLHVCGVECGASEHRGMETGSDDSQKNAVFGIMVSNTSKKAPVEGVGEFTTSTPSSFERFFARFHPLLYCPFGLA